MFQAVLRLLGLEQPTIEKSADGAPLRYESNFGKEYATEAVASSLRRSRSSP